MSDVAYAAMPTYQNIEPATIPAELMRLLDKNKTKLAELLEKNTTPSWQSLMQPLENMGDELQQYWSTISHLHSVMNSPALREAYNQCLPTLSQYHTEISHNYALYTAIQQVEKSEGKHLSKAQQKILEHDLRDFKLAGVTLDAEKKHHFAEISKRLAELAAKFEQNLLDATHAWHFYTENGEDLSGLPESTKALAKMLAEQHGKSSWWLTLDMPIYQAVMTYADQASLRKQMYYAYTTRASDQGPNAGQFDNSAVIDETLALRHELAQLLGFNNFAEYSLATKMVRQPSQVIEFLNSLLAKALPKAKQEVAELQAFAKEQYGVTELEACDIAYYSEKLKQARYAISQEDLRPYFAEANVLNGLFEIVKRLFGIRVQQEMNAETWHPDVRCYAVYDANNQLRAKFFIDLYARENKRGGAWMDECRVRRRLDDGSIQIPIAYLTCNLNRPVGDMPALFTHDEVETLFHEFGHCLQHMLTKVEYADVSGINGVPWDAVELASQFLENWAWQKESLYLFAKHYQTGEPLPAALYEKMQRAKNFQRAMALVRQLQFSLFDFRLHLEYSPEVRNPAQTLLDSIREQTHLFPVPAFNRFQHGFSHIFAGGYAAGYYSYLWAEVMACDAFSLFEEKGLFDQATSQRFLECILETGGTEEPMVLFEAFRGRKPQVDALLKQMGV